MTKKELLESEVFQKLPEDAEIVFATHEKISKCYRVEFLNISMVKQDEKCALLVDAIPYWLLKEKYGITFNDEPNKK